MKYLSILLVLGFISCNSAKKNNIEETNQKLVETLSKSDSICLNPESIKYELKMIHDNKLWDYMKENQISRLDSTVYFIKNQTLYIEYLYTFRGGLYEDILLKNKKDSCYISLESRKYDDDEPMTSVEGNALYNIEIPLKNIKCDYVYFREVKIEK